MLPLVPAGIGFGKMLLYSLFGSAASGVISGLFGLAGDALNRKEERRQQEEAREMAERQFAWGQNLDRFKMTQDVIDTRHKLTQSRVDRLNEVLRNNIGLQQHVRQLWGGK